MTDKQIDRILDGLGTLAGKLGETATDLWEILIRQAIISGIGYIFGSLVVVVLVVVVGKKGRAINQLRTPKSYDESKEFVSVVIGVLQVISTIISLFTAIYGGKMILNPGYYAALTLLDAVR